MESATAKLIETLKAEKKILPCVLVGFRYFLDEFSTGKFIADKHVIKQISRYVKERHFTFGPMKNLIFEIFDIRADRKRYEGSKTKVVMFVFSRPDFKVKIIRVLDMYGITLAELFVDPPRELGWVPSVKYSWRYKAGNDWRALSQVVSLSGKYNEEDGPLLYYIADGRSTPLMDLLAGTEALTWGNSEESAWRKEIMDSDAHADALSESAYKQKWAELQAARMLAESRGRRRLGLKGFMSNRMFRCKRIFLCQQRYLSQRTFLSRKLLVNQSGIRSWYESHSQKQIQCYRELDYRKQLLSPEELAKSEEALLNDGIELDDSGSIHWEFEIAIPDSVAAIVAALEARSKLATVESTPLNRSDLHPRVWPGNELAVPIPPWPFEPTDKAYPKNGKLERDRWVYWAHEHGNTWRKIDEAVRKLELHDPKTRQIDRHVVSSEKPRFNKAGTYLRYAKTYANWIGER